MRLKRDFRFNRQSIPKCGQPELHPQTISLQRTLVRGNKPTADTLSAARNYGHEYWQHEPHTWLNTQIICTRASLGFGPLGWQYFVITSLQTAKPLSPSHSHSQSLSDFHSTAHTQKIVHLEATQLCGRSSFIGQRKSQISTEKTMIHSLGSKQADRQARLQKLMVIRKGRSVHKK